MAASRDRVFSAIQAPRSAQPNWTVAARPIPSTVTTRTPPLPDEDWSSGQLAMCQAFADAVRSGAPAEADGALGRDVTRVVYAAYLSAAEGRRVSLDAEQ